MKKLSDLKVGDTVFVVEATWRRDDPIATRHAMVLSMGRKLITVESKWGKPDKFDKESGIQSSTTNYKDRIYVSQEAYEAGRALTKAFGKLRSYFGGYGGPLQPGVTVEDIMAAAALLKINMEKE
jgi:hypothetical protein